LSGLDKALPKPDKQAFRSSGSPRLLNWSVT